MRSPALALTVVLAATLAIVVPAGADTLLPAEEQLEEARERRAAVEERLATEAGDLEGLEEQVHEVEQQVAELEQRDQELRAELDEIEASLARRSRVLFMRGDTTTLHVLLSSQDFGDVADGAALLESLALRDRASVEDAQALRTSLEVNRQERASRLDELATLQADLQEKVDQLMADLEQLQQDEERFGEELARQREELRRQREEEERRRREAEARAAAEAEAAAAAAAAEADEGGSDDGDDDEPTAGGQSDAAPPGDATATGGLACPVGDPVVFSDTWGAPRSGGRSHQGVDMMARHGTPVYAITSGRITRMNSSGLGGISLYMYGDDGNEYFYTHLQGYADVSTGDTVAAGTLIAYVGSTGNASASAPHLHFEVHPGGGGAVNPYPYAARACGR